MVSFCICNVVTLIIIRTGATITCELSDFIFHGAMRLAHPILPSTKVVAQLLNVRPDTTLKMALEIS